MKMLFLCEVRCSIAAICPFTLCYLTKFNSMKQFIVSLCMLILSGALVTSCYHEEDDTSAFEVEFKSLTLSQIKKQLQGEWAYVKTTTGIPGTADEQEKDSRIVYMDEYIAADPPYISYLTFDGDRMRRYDEAGVGTEWKTIEWLKGHVSLGYECYYYYGLHSLVEFTPEIPVGIRNGMLVISIDHGEGFVGNCYYKPR